MTPDWRGLNPPYGAIMADPPWPIAGRRMGVGGRRAHKTSIPYSLSSIEDVKRLPVAELAAPSCVLFLWTTRRLFREGTAVDVAKAWGFEPCGEIIWGLRNLGMGAAMGASHEPVLVARRGKVAWKTNRPIGVVFWQQPYAIQNGRAGKLHSAKPAGLGDLVEELVDGPYVELFARQPRLGWDSWGRGFERVTQNV